MQHVVCRARYFSPTGTTKKSAQKLAGLLNADLYEICPEVPYTDADLDWRNGASRSSAEMNDPASRPAVADHNANVEAYDTVFIGFPIWWYTAPTIIKTFIEAYDFSGKVIVFFATSGGSDVMKATTDLMEVLKGKGKVRGGIVMGKPKSEELVVDEMLAICSEIEAWREKKASEEANARYKEMLYYGLDSEDRS